MLLFCRLVKASLYLSKYDAGLLVAYKVESNIVIPLLYQITFTSFYDAWLQHVDLVFEGESLVNEAAFFHHPACEGGFLQLGLFPWKRTAETHAFCAAKVRE